MNALTRIDRYRIEEIIGTGGFATVYRAMDERFDTPVAIKVLADNHAYNPEVRERFITEVQLLRRLAGVPAVAVYDLGETEQGQPYAVMALADGDLGARVKRFSDAGNTIGWAEVSRIIDELARSLEPLHARGIVHRDIKPSNLLVFGELGTGADRSPAPGADTWPAPGAGAVAAPEPGQLLTGWEALRLGDLGFAKDLLFQSGLTAGGGTPGFMPPEQARPGRVDTRADIYAATSVVVWLICRQVPTSLTPIELEHKVAAALGAGCSVAGLQAGLAEQIDQRPQTVDRWRDLLYDTLSPIRTTADQQTTGIVTRYGSVGTPSNAPSNGPGAVVSAASPGTPFPGDTTRVTPPPSGDSSGGRSVRVVLVAALCALSAIAAVLVAPALGLGDDPTEVTESEDGVRRSRTADGLTVTLIGPDRLEVGQAVTFTAEVTGARSVQWIGPDGTVADGAEPLVVQASRAGDGSVSLLATSIDSGEAVVVEAPFEVVEP